MAHPDINREHRKSLAAITGDPERALLHGRRAFATLPENAGTAQQANVLQRMVTEADAIKSDSPGRAFVTAHGALDLAGQMPDGVNRTQVKKSALQAMGSIATTTLDSGNRDLGGKMLEKALVLAQGAGFGYEADVLRGVKLARGETVTAPEPLRDQPPHRGANPRRGRNAELDALQRSQANWREGQAVDLTGGDSTISANPTGGGKGAAAGSLSPDQPERTKLSAVGDSPHRAPKQKSGVARRLAVIGGTAAVVTLGLIVAGGLISNYRNATQNYDAMRQAAIESAARERAAVSVDPTYARQYGITPDGMVMKDILETFRQRHPTEFHDIAVEMKRTGMIEGGLNRMAVIDPSIGPNIRTQGLAFVEATMGQNGTTDYAQGNKALISIINRVDFNGTQADALRRGDVQRVAPAGPAPR